MKLTVQQTEKLLKSNQSFSQLGLSMMITRLRKRYVNEPSQAVLKKSTDEINAYLGKFSMIMEADYKVIIKIT